jgi:hypothetical protein
MKKDRLHPMESNIRPEILRMDYILIRKDISGVNQLGMKLYLPGILNLF